MNWPLWKQMEMILSYTHEGIPVVVCYSSVTEWIIIGWLGMKSWYSGPFDCLPESERGVRGHSRLTTQIYAESYYVVNGQYEVATNVKISEY